MPSVISNISKHEQNLCLEFFCFSRVELISSQWEPGGTVNLTITLIYIWEERRDTTNFIKYLPSGLFLSLNCWYTKVRVKYYL